jgi:hypothetical protein
MRINLRCSFGITIPNTKFCQIIKAHHTLNPTRPIFSLPRLRLSGKVAKLRGRVKSLSAVRSDLEAQLANERLRSAETQKEELEPHVSKRARSWMRCKFCTKQRRRTWRPHGRRCRRRPRAWRRQSRRAFAARLQRTIEAQQLPIHALSADKTEAVRASQTPKIAELTLERSIR